LTNFYFLQPFKSFMNLKTRLTTTESLTSQLSHKAKSMFLVSPNPSIINNAFC
jgi:hypothetical protein